MNVDTPIQPLAAIASPARSVHTPAEQVSNRPVERPHHAEAADNQGKQEITRAEARKEQAHSGKHHHTPRHELGAHDASRPNSAQSIYESNDSQSAPVGSLLDVEA